MSKWRLVELQSGYQLRRVGMDGAESIIGSGAYLEVGRQIMEDHNAMPKMRAALDGIADRINKTRQWGGGARKGMIDGLEALAKAALADAET